MKKKILVIDDDPTTQTLVGFLLKNHEYAVIIAADGDEGLEKARSENPDLIVLDIAMPKMDGFSFLNELKEEKGGNIPPVIMLTSKGNMQDVFEVEGVAAYFVKPLDSDKFLSKVEEFV